MVAGKYRIGRKLGGGSFGDIYLGAWMLAVQCRHSIAGKCRKGWN